MDKLTEKDIIERIKLGYSLPSLSAVAIKLVEIASNEYSSLSEMSELIERDPGLTARLIRIANSAFFRASEPISTIEQSIMRVGSNHLRVMALSLSLRDTFPMGKVGPMDFEKFWRSSLYQALLAKSFAQRLHTCNPEEAFVGGLILEIGLLIFFDMFVKGKGIERNLDLQPLEELLAWETDNYGINHRQVGAAALSFWKFPSIIVECQHFHSIESKEEKIPPLALVCEMAREFSALICKESIEWGTLFHKAEEIYNIDHDMLTDILIATFDEVQQVAGGLKVEMDKDKDILGLVEKANVSLSGLSEKILELQETASKHGLPSFENMTEIENDQDVKYTLQAVAHEIRNPLMAVSGFAKKLSGALDPSSDGWKYVQIIIDESVRLESALSKMTGSRRNG
ncbi:MAG: HDOD domain-containing protein [Nitrospirae bacterium]|nr:HDOD domain-containing protein [Nitrospirota bacterium]